MVMGCGAAGGRALRVWGIGARWGKGCYGGGCVVMLRQTDASVMGKSTPLGLSAAQTHKESVQMGADACAQVLAYKNYYKLCDVKTLHVV